MAQVKIIGDQCIVISAVKKEELEKLARYKPEALKLTQKDEEGNTNEQFRIAIGNTPSVSNHGIVFSSRNQNDYAIAAQSVNPGDQDIQDYVLDKFGYGLLSLNKLESELDSALQNLATDFNTMRESISIE